MLGVIGFMGKEDDLSIPYRCPHCHSLLTRQRVSEVLEAIQAKHTYTCGICWGMMPAQKVESGELDIQIELPPCRELQGVAPHDLRDLLSYLRSWHRADYVYRGQVRVWPGPLVPSLYRGTIAQEACEAPPRLRLRELGQRFHAVRVAETPEPKFMRRIRFNSQLHQIFGYPFGSMLAQQCGVTSEGLDISHDPDVAAFFAVFDYLSQSFARDGTGVIYRIHVSDAQTGLKDLRAASFFDCPSVISAYLNFHQLQRVGTWAEARASFIEYGYRVTMDPESLRPLQLLSLPRDDLALCRVVQQRAGLLFPDVVLSREHNQAHRKPPSGKAEWEGPLLIEDVSAREGVDVFEFRHDVRNQYCVPRSPAVLFPKDDGITRFLKDFLATNPKFYFVTEFGIFGSEDVHLIE